MTNDQPITWEREPATRNARTAVEYLLLELEDSEDRKRARRKADRERLRAALSALILELYAARRDGTDGWRRYSRAKASFDTRSRYFRSPVTHSTSCTAADWLLAEGYAEGQLGYYRSYPEFGKGAGAGAQSRIRATDKLLQFLVDDFCLPPSDVGFAPWAETIILREGKRQEKRKIEYEDTAETIRWRENLTRINSFLNGFKLSREDDNGSIIDLPPFLLKRIFSRGSFETGGRFYGGPWVPLRSEERPSLLIDGEEVVELDFSSFHPRLIYQLEGKPWPAQTDPYGVDGWEDAPRREWVKTAFQKLINGEPGAKLRKPKDANEIGEDEWQELLQALAELHEAIGGWFRSGGWGRLQRIDSDIAEGVLLRMVDQGICCLSIHDNFIVPRSHETGLRQAMKEAYIEVVSRLGGDTVEPIIHVRDPAVPLPPSCIN